ncbi:unnamed protein product [Urochloa decumbens]|uniref:Uncharacterized protein n=1 Tax=Urochloa decumbens TaxID=240449 RepID=A0ABC9CK79_9POAL
MRTSLSLAAAAVFLVLLLTTMEAQAIRLDAESRAAVSQSQQQTVNNKPSENLAQKDAPVKRSAGESETKRSIATVKSSVGGESETKRSIATVKSSVGGESETKRSIAGQEVMATAHKLPEFHEDYYGASVHEPRHH